MRLSTVALTKKVSARYDRLRQKTQKLITSTVKKIVSIMLMIKEA